MDSLQPIADKYEILQQISEGGMGAIYRVRHRLLGEERVVKVLRPQVEQDDTVRQRFLREAKAISRLSHPNIAQLHDFTLDREGVAYLVMELIRGLTFEELIARRGPLPLGLVLEMAVQSLGAIGHLHARGVIHRDIAPDNLMLTRDVDGGPLVKLIDLGIAKSADRATRLTASGIFMGKIRYASPEQFQADQAGEVSPSSDLYSFGLVLYELLTHHYPISGESPSSIIAGHLFRPPLDFARSDPEGRVPEDLRALVLRTLAKHTVDRFADAARLAAELIPIRRRHALDDREASQALSRALTLSAAAPPPRPAAGDEATIPMSARVVHGPRVRELIRAAREDAVGADYPSALARLQEALELTPEDGQLRSLLRDTEKAGRRHDHQQQLEQAVAERAQLIVALLERDRVDEARDVLKEAGEVFGKHPRLAELRVRCEEEAQRTRRTLPAAGNDALERSVEELLSAGRFEEAERQLLANEGELTPTLEALHLRVELGLEAEKRQRDDAARRRRADELVEKARALSQAEDFAGAQTALVEAEELVPDHQAARTLSSSIEGLLTLQTREQETSEVMAAAIAEVRKLLGQGRAGEAMQRLQRSLRRFGPRQELQELRYEVAEAFLDDASGIAPQIEPTVGGPVTATLTERVPPPLPARERPLPGPAAAVPAEAPQAAEIASGEFADMTLAGIGTIPATADEAPVEPSGGPAARPGAAPAAFLDLKSPRFWVLVAVMVAAFALLGMWLASGPSPEPRQQEPTLEVEDVESPVPSSPADPP